MKDEWLFEIGDGQTYGPYPLDKLRKWAAAGNLMPTHRVRHVDSSEWMIAAYVPGLEGTVADPQGPAPTPTPQETASFRSTLAAMGRVIVGKKKDKVAKDSEPDEETAESPSPSKRWRTNPTDKSSVESSAKAPNEPRGTTTSAPTEPPNIVDLCHGILETAFERGASDIHLDPEEHFLLVQLRVDGVLETLRKLAKSLQGPILSRFKILARMDIAERRMPQDGRFREELGPNQCKVEFRAALLPTTHGERLTLRLLGTETGQLTMNKLGLPAFGLKAFAKAMSAGQGLVLVTGPTGSGKSTTLYAAIRHLLAHHPGKIITIEDPVEFDLVGVAQVELEASDKVRFDTALRNVLRSDPDVIMIG
ncbi:MAG TPA: ATPase, T2SS/T4P/T4SS family, partial [Pirellulaceae bacterium]